MHLDLVLHNADKIQLQTDKTSVVIGRSSKCDIVISHESMSRQHCRIDFSDGGYFVTDLGSSNGVFIDDTKIEPNTPTPFQTYLNLSFGFVTSCHINAEAPVKDVPAQDNPQQNFGSLPVKARTPAPRATSEAPREKSKTQSYLLNIVAFLGVIFAIYYYMTHEKPVANTLESNPKNSEITESDLF